MFVSTEDPHDSFPKLKGRAAEVRSLMPALAAVWQHYMHPREMVHHAVLRGLQSSALMDEIVDSYPDADTLPSADAARCVDASWLYARCQNAAAQCYNVQEQMMILDCTIKTHYVRHGALRTQESEKYVQIPAYGCNLSEQHERGVPTCGV